MTQPSRAGEMVLVWMKMRFDGQSKSILIQHFASTSHDPQPFGISSGTFGCTNNGMTVREEQTSRRY